MRYTSTTGVNAVVSSSFRSVFLSVSSSAALSPRSCWPRCLRCRFSRSQKAHPARLDLVNGAEDLRPSFGEACLGFDPHHEQLAEAGSGPWPSARRGNHLVVHRGCLTRPSPLRAVSSKRSRNPPASRTARAGRSTGAPDDQRTGAASSLCPESAEARTPSRRGTEGHPVRHWASRPLRQRLCASARTLSIRREGSHVGCREVLRIDQNSCVGCPNAHQPDAAASCPSGVPRPRRIELIAR